MTPPGSHEARLEKGGVSPQIGAGFADARGNRTNKKNGD